MSMQTLEISQVPVAISHLKERLFRDFLKKGFLQHPNRMVARNAV